MGISNLSRGSRLLVILVLHCTLMYLLYLLIDLVILPSITSGSATEQVPNVIGKSYDVAKITAHKKNLQIEVTKEIYNENLPSGAVITQVPAPNAVVKSGRFVYVTISKGKELVPVPYITGLTQRTAKLNLIKAGLEMGNIGYEFNDNVGKDTIISQNSKPGTRVAYGNKINVVISKGPESQIKIPSLIGLSLAEAKQLIIELELVLGHIDYKPDGTYLPDIVVNQSPQPGELAKPQQIINITITQ